MIPIRSESSPPPLAREDGCPQLAGRFGSLDAFWRLIEPVLTHLQPRRICEIGVEKGIFTSRLLAWGRENGCAYVGIDPAPDPAVSDRMGIPHARQEGMPADQLLTSRSLEALPELPRCDVYFVDGDHNYHTVRNELESIRRTSENVGGTVIFAHDVSWPFARRDMYHDPAAIPPEERHEYSDELGASLDGDELIAGGLRAPGQYSVALHAGGPRNGVLTAIEDFLDGEAGRGWRSIIVPIAYGLAILYRPEDGALPERCRNHLNDLRDAIRVTGKFFESCEANFLQLYLYSEDAKYHLAEQTRAVRLEQGAHYDTLEAYKALEAAYKDLEGAYKALDAAHKDASVYNEALMGKYHRLQGVQTTLENECHDLRRRCDALQGQADRFALPRVLPEHDDGDPPPAPRTAEPGSGPGE